MKQGYLAEVFTDGQWFAIDQQPWQADSMKDAVKKLRGYIKDDLYNASEGCGPQPGDMVRVYELDEDGMESDSEDFKA